MKNIERINGVIIEGKMNWKTENSVCETDYRRIDEEELANNWKYMLWWIERKSIEINIYIFILTFIIGIITRRYQLL